MEVHRHSHTERKKWTHYFWDFLMLFLAVFCGFLAENIREHKIEKEREKQYIETMIDDLKEDTILLNKKVTEYRQKGIELDSLFLLLNLPGNKEYGAALYYYGRKANRFDFFTSTDRTIQQMKNSGAFRLIRNNNAANNILKYYSELSELYRLQQGTDDLMMDYRLISYTLFDPIVFQSMVNDRTENNITYPPDNPSLITNEKAPIQRLSSIIHYLQGSRMALNKMYIGLKKQAAELIEILKTEYHLK
ncbi:MAG TPA: hypothetical protein VFU29_23580 [Chitinophagaceae bacterium]|nr:hypothetical protein [Chitinophagaceae bacterium]